MILSVYIYLYVYLCIYLSIYLFAGQPLLGSGVCDARRVLPETVAAGLQHQLPQEQPRQRTQHHHHHLADDDGAATRVMDGWMDEWKH